MVRRARSNWEPTLTSDIQRCKGVGAAHLLNDAGGLSVDATCVAVVHRLTEADIERKRKLVDRRRFLGAMAAAVIAGRTKILASNAIPSRVVGHSLVPEQPSGAPNYWC